MNLDGSCWRIRDDPGEGPSNRSAHHIPDDHAINPLLSRDDFSAEASVNARPGVQPRVCARVRADAPDDEFLSVRRPFKIFVLFPSRHPFSSITPTRPDFVRTT